MKFIVDAQLSRHLTPKMGRGDNPKGVLMKVNSPTEAVNVLQKINKTSGKHTVSH